MYFVVSLFRLLALLDVVRRDALNDLFMDMRKRHFLIWDVVKKGLFLKKFCPFLVAVIVVIAC